MTLGELVGQNLASPAVLAFVLGAVAVRLKSDLRFPESITSLLSTYLLLAIGLKGGLRLRDALFHAPTVGECATRCCTPLNSGTTRWATSLLAAPGWLVRTRVVGEALHPVAMFGRSFKHPSPQRVWLGIKSVVRRGIEHEPVLTGNLAVKLRWAPA